MAEPEMHIYSNNEDTQTGKGGNLKTLDEGPEENPDGVALSQQLDQAGCSEEAEETNIEEVFLKLKIININILFSLHVV